MSRRQHSVTARNDAAPRALPSQEPQRIALDTLLARNAPSQRRTPSPPGSPVPRAPVRPERDTPTALVLWVTIRHCECGTVTRSPADYILARYQPNEHSYRYSRAALADCLPSLPRETHEVHHNIPFCEECFLMQHAEECMVLSS